MATLQFPSLEWFGALRAAANADPERSRRLGTVDMTLVAKIDFGATSRCFEIVFYGYRCVSVRHLPDLAAAAPAAVVLEGPYEAWREMIENIEANSKADLAHTLNTLTLRDTPLRVRSENQLDVDKFYRYQQNLQEFFDDAAQFRTAYGWVNGQSAIQ